MVRVELPAQGVADLFNAREMLCPTHADQGPWVHIIDVNVGVPSPEALPVSIALEISQGMYPFDRTEPAKVHVTTVGTTTPGLEVVSADLPMTFRAGPDNTLDAQWRVTDCDLAADFRDVQFSLTSGSDDGPEAKQGSSQVHNLPGEVIVAITRFVADTCDS